MSTLQYAGHTHLYGFPSFRVLLIFVVFRRITGGVDLEMLEAAVDYRWVNVCLKYGTRKFEQDDERERLMGVQLLVGDKRLQDVTADRSFLYISEVGPVCDEVNICIEVGGIYAIPRDHQVIAGELSEGPCAEAVL